MLGKDINTYSLDFYILDTNDPKSILLLDRSNYLFEPENPKLFIVPPGYTGEINIEYPGIKNSIIEINSDSIGLTENCNINEEFANLPDGVWQITMSVCPYEELYNKKCYLKTTQIECKLQDILLRFDDCGCLPDKEFKNLIVDIDILLQSAKAEVSICNIENATKKYNQALKLLNQIEKKLNCK